MLLSVPNNSIVELLYRLWFHVSMRRRRQLGLLSVLMVLASLAEILSIGAVLPFLSVLTAPEKVFVHVAAQPLINTLDLHAPEQLLLPLTFAFVTAALISGLIRLFLLWASIRLSFAVGADLGINTYRRTLYQPYSVHCARNTSEVIDGISVKTDVVIYNVIVPVLMILSAIVMLTIILIAMFVFDPFIALSVFGGFGLIYLLIILLTKNKLIHHGHRMAKESTLRIKSLQEGLGGIRDVLIDGSQAIYCQAYRNVDLPLRRAQGSNLFISNSPRFLMEVLGMILIAALAYNYTQQTDGIAKAIPTLGALALGAQRLLPLLQQAYAAWSGIRGGQASLQAALELLDQTMPVQADQPAKQSLPFFRNISLKQLGFRYSLQTPYVFKQLDLTIAKGSRVGFVGTSGSGKSTLLDILMGLLQPTEGLMEVDGEPVTPFNTRLWQAHIAHVPQVIFLVDASIEENIAFSVPKDLIDHQRVRKAAQQAQIADSIETWPEKYQTVVGERGVRLSGGQRQRIGIARALYKQADVIIFDEATSALDSETEQAVIQSIEGLSEDITVLIIAHRVTTLKNCTQIIELGDGAIKSIGCYQDIANRVITAS